MKHFEIRAARSALAVALAIFLADTVEIDPMSDSGFYAGIAAAIATQAFYVDTIRVGLGRIYSTFIGAIAAGVILLFLPTTPEVLRHSDTNPVVAAIHIIGPYLSNTIKR